MQISPCQSKGVFDAQVAYFHKATEQFGSRVKTCQMDGDSMQPTIEPYEIVAVAECGGEIKTEGIYAYSCFFLGKGVLVYKAGYSVGWWSFTHYSRQSALHEFRLLSRRSITANYTRKSCGFNESAEVRMSDKNAYYTAKLLAQVGYWDIAVIYLRKAYGY